VDRIYCQLFDLKQFQIKVTLLVGEKTYVKHFLLILRLSCLNTSRILQYHAWYSLNEKISFNDILLFVR